MLINRGLTGVNEWLGHDGVVELHLLHQMRGSRRPQVGSQVGKQVYNVVIRWRTGCGKAYLSMDVATESEVADTKGSTATGAPL